jgi:hypothetical protein
VDIEGLLQVSGAFAGVAVAQVAVADAFQGRASSGGVPRSRAMASAWAW